MGIHLVDLLSKTGSWRSGEGGFNFWKCVANMRAHTNTHTQRLNELDVKMVAPSCFLTEQVWMDQFNLTIYFSLKKGVAVSEWWTFFPYIFFDLKKVKCWWNGTRLSSGSPRYGTS